MRAIRADTVDTVVPALDAVRRAVEADGLHAAGFLSYEAAPAFDPAMTVRPGGELPLLWFGLFDGCRAPDPAGAGAGTDPAGAGAERAPLEWAADTSADRHAAAIHVIREAIAAGQTYQVNLTTRLRAPFTGDPEALYHGLRRAQGDGYHALLDLGRHVIVSASPELFFRVEGREITTRPMKGTRPRGRWPEEDRALADALRASPKDRAENLMITDLLRNDLGRVCVPDSIRVPALQALEAYRTVWQLTSTVTGRLRNDVTLVDVFRGLFPCGSVTGAPKISTMGIIADLETSPREVYCGAIGWVRPGGDWAFSVPIRTAWIDRQRQSVAYGTGGGVVWDSTPDQEWDELVAKAAVVRDPWPPFRLLETLALEDGRPVRLERHLRRMAGSADRFGFPFPADDLRAAIDGAAGHHPEGRHRLRVTLSDRGQVAVEVAELGRTGSGSPGPSGQDEGDARGGSGDPVPVVVAGSPVDPSDLFLYHKTTRRAVYDRRLAAAPEHAFDVLLWNERGEATEFCRGNLVAEVDGRLLTPPRAAGLLPGCLRAELLEEGRIQEAALTVDEVRSADRVWFINSARGWIRVRVEA